jgi:hypothetical protein
VLSLIVSKIGLVVDSAKEIAHDVNAQYPEAAPVVGNLALALGHALLGEPDQARLCLLKSVQVLGSLEAAPAGK